MEEIKSKVYVRTDERGRIIRCEGGYTAPVDLSGWTEIDEGTGDRYNLAQSNYFPGGLYTADGIPLYKLQDGKPWSARRTRSRRTAQPSCRLRRLLAPKI